MESRSSRKAFELGRDTVFLGTWQTAVLCLRLPLGAVYAGLYFLLKYGCLAHIGCSWGFSWLSSLIFRCCYHTVIWLSFVLCFSPPITSCSGGSINKFAD